MRYLFLIALILPACASSYEADYRKCEKEREDLIAYCSEIYLLLEQASLACPKKT